MRIGFRTRCHPTAALVEVLAQWIGCQRAVGNAKHEELRYLLWLRKRAILSPSWAGTDPQGAGFPLDQTFSQFKDPELSPWLSTVPAQILRNGVVLYKRAWTNRLRNPSHFHAPRRKRKWERNSVWLTRELFRFKGPGLVELGTAAHPVGLLPFVAHRHLPEPDSLTITRTRYGHWFLSFASDALAGPEVVPDENRLLALAERGDLAAQVLGVDRGVVLAAACSNGTCLRMEDPVLERLSRLERRKSRHQRVAARRQKGSRRREKTLGKVARFSARIASIREDFLRKAAHAVAQMAPAVVAMEALNLKGMVRRPKAKRSESGAWEQNGARRKAGLNRALVRAGMGRFGIFLRHALRKEGKVLIEVPARHSSQECSSCGHTEAGNRPSQAVFHCRACGHHDHADLNAAKVIQKRGIAQILTAGTAGSARPGPARPGRPQGRGAVRRNQGLSPSAAPVKRKTPSSRRRACAA